MYFYQKPPKSQSFVRHISKRSLIQSSLFGSSSNFSTCEYSCTPGYPRFPWLIIPLRQACTRSISCSGSQLNHPFTSCSSTQLQELFQIPWGTCAKSCEISETENTTTCKIFFFFLGISLVQASFSRVLSSSRQNKQPSVPVRWLAHRVRGCGISYG